MYSVFDLQHFFSFRTETNYHRAQRIPAKLANTGYRMATNLSNAKTLQFSISQLVLSMFILCLCKPQPGSWANPADRATARVSCRRCTGMQWRAREREREGQRAGEKGVPCIGLLVVCLRSGPLDSRRNQCERLEIILYVSNLNLMCKS